MQEVAAFGYARRCVLHSSAAASPAETVGTAGALVGGMSDATIKTGWQVNSASVSEHNGGLRVEGVNHDATETISRYFIWDIRESVNDPRYDFSGCTFHGNAQAVYQRLRAKGEEP